MNSLSTYPAKTRGSTLLAVMMVIVLLALAAGSALQFSSTGYRASVRQNALEQAKITGESDMEYLYYRWKTLAINHTAPADIATQLGAAGLTVPENQIPSTLGAPFLPLQSGPIVGRSLEFLPPTAIGNIPGTNRIASTSSFRALERVNATAPGIGNTVFQFGRRFTYSQVSLFQYSVFYQGNMEFSTGSPLTIKGNISCNSSIFIGSDPSVTLTIVNNMTYAALFDGASDNLSGTYHRATDTGPGNDGLIDPIFNPDPESSAPDQPTARAAQVAPLAQPENFIGGVNAAQAVASYPQAYSNTNDVYRSIIAPPPVDASHNPIPEDPIIASRRMYNQAGLRITIGATTPNSVSVIVPSDPLTDYAPAFTAPGGPITVVRTPVFDARENRTVMVTEIDVGKLATMISTTDMIKNNYTGVVYLLDDNNGYTDGAFRLVDGTTTPNNGSKGFTVATNNGLYVKGDYNTDTPTTPGVTNSAALMADAITLLSPGWNDANSTGPLPGRAVTIDDSTAINPITGALWVTATTSPTATIAQDNYITVSAAMISGNTPNAASTSTGGVQNLVRFLEDWYGDPTSNTRFVGSLGQLFTSVYFTGLYQTSGYGNNIYTQPHHRYLEFDSNLAANPPGGTPTVTTFSRGDYFTW